MAKFGLIGKNIDYSFSQEYFIRKFERENLAHTFQNFDISSIEAIKNIISKNKDLKGLNITIPYKESIIPYLDKIDKEAKSIGAVNTIKIEKDNTLIGYNTDNYGFAKALIDFFPLTNKKALVLGTGGASKAITYVLDALNFEYKCISRTKGDNCLSYNQLSGSIIEEHRLIVNCTPLGTHPNINECPTIPYRYLNENHLLFDLVYNPAETLFLKKGKSRNARTSNGLIMLEYQAEKSWRIWNS